MASGGGWGIAMPGGAPANALSHFGSSNCLIDKVLCRLRTCVGYPHNLATTTYSNNLLDSPMPSKRKREDVSQCSVDMDDDFIDSLMDAIHDGDQRFDEEPETAEVALELRLRSVRRKVLNMLCRVRCPRVWSSNERDICKQFLELPADQQRRVLDAADIYYHKDAFEDDPRDDADQPYFKAPPPEDIHGLPEFWNDLMENGKAIVPLPEDPEELPEVSDFNKALDEVIQQQRNVEEMLTRMSADEALDELLHHINFPVCSHLTRAEVSAAVRRDIPRHSIDARGKHSVWTFADDCSAVIPVALQPNGCRLAREMGCTIYCVDWGTRRSKPSVLIHRVTQNTLQLIAGREDGRYYYAPKPLGCSPTARRLKKSLSPKDFNSRILLMLTPTTTITLPEDVAVTLVADELNESEGKTTDGQAEGGWYVCRALGMDIPQHPSTERVLCRTVQWRGVLRLTDGSNNTVFGKGLVVYNPDLDCNELRLRKSNVKAQWVQSHEDRCGVDVCSQSTRPCKRPELTPQLTTCLATLASLDPTDGANAAYGRLLPSARREKWNDIARSAWCLPRPRDEVNVGVPVRPPPPRYLPQADPWANGRRTPYEQIKLRYQAGRADEDPAEEWDAAVEETNCSNLSHGTRDALLRGRCDALQSLNSLRKKPRGAFRGFSCMVTAISDTTRKLADRTCYLVVNGRIHLGKFAVWRYPAMSPTDIEVWTAIEPPANVVLHDNTVVCSRLGNGILTLSGGDYDGDLLCFTNDPDVITIALTRIPGEVQSQFNRWRQEIDDHFEALTQIDDEKWADVAGCNHGVEARYKSFAEYSQYLAEASTPNLRGTICGMVERAQTKVLQQSTPPPTWSGDSWDAWKALVQLTEVCYRAYDAPKKHSVRDVLTKGKELMAGFGLGVWPRASLCACTELAPLQEYVSAMDVFRAFNLDGLKQDPCLGKVWLHRSQAKLGAAAGRRVRQILLQSKKPLTWTPSFKRTCIRRPIVEIAHLIGHRLAHNDFEEVRELLVSQNRAEVCRRIAECRARPFGTARALSNSLLK